MSLQLDRPLVVLDLETTSNNIATDRIIELALIRLEPDRAEPTMRIVGRCNPGMPIHPDATKVHGITDDDVREQPPFADYAAAITDCIAGADLMGFGIKQFDLPILRREMMEAGAPFSLQGRRLIDAKTIYHKREPRTLAAAVAFYCKREHMGAHGAEADALASLDVLRAQLAHYPAEPLPCTSAELHELCGGDEGVALDCAGKFVLNGGRAAFAFGEHAGKPVLEVARAKPSYLQWMLGAGFAPDTKEIARKALEKAQEQA